MHPSEKKYIQKFDGETLLKVTFWRVKGQWEDSIKWAIWKLVYGVSGLA
jgi:hypothetical protein